MKIQLLTTTFGLPLKFRDISRWRGAWCEMVGWDVDFFHNHRDGDGKVLYRYPLIQYRCDNDCASFVALQDAVPAVQSTVASSIWNIQWKEHTTPLSMTNFQVNTHELKRDTEFHTYRIYNYLPFNSENLKQWQSTPLLIDKTALLTRLIPGHLISFAKGIQWRIPGHFDVEITNLTSQHPVVLHEVLRPAFDLEFRTQLFLPSGIGIGKGVSHGFGVLERQKTQ
ncbi:CRISPR-associated endonuclease Cas6 [Lewinella sp. LCG006]|uniref:CRISPR-associated endonuclease Cas6 n=1 Tax=Lewinella sp. LCG006 TaxID=3231911 RepID=UPI0034613CC4